MNWLRAKLRAWLGYDDLCIAIDAISAALAKVQTDDLDALQTQLTEFKEALKRKVQPSVPVYRMPDYETDQIAALQEFKEKKEK